ncbi:MAG: NADH-quinone oxidoreductase subunit M, partial [Nitrospiraceae bacterium]
STGALFMVVGAIQERIHTRDSRRMGGLWATVPKMAAIALFFAIASLGLPGLGNFIGEFLVLLGTYPVSIVATVAAAGGLVAAVIYSLAFMHRAFYGPNTEGWRIPDFSRSALVMFGTMIVVQIWLGMYPQPVLKTVEPALNGLRSIVDSMIVTSTR